MRRGAPATTSSANQGRAQHHHRAHVRLEQDQRRHDQADWKQRDQQMLGPMKHLGLADQQVRPPQHQCELGEFRGLELTAWQRDPAARTELHRSDARDQDPEQTHPGHRQQGIGKPAKRADRQRGADHQQHQTDQRPTQLPTSDREQRPGAGVGHHAGGRQHHDQTDAQQRCR